MLAGIKEILVISTPEDMSGYQRLLGDGSDFGVEIEYAIQPSPDGLAQAFLIAEDFIGDNNVALVLGDNIFFGENFSAQLEKGIARKKGATIFSYHVNNPEEFGVIPEYNEVTFANNDINFKDKTNIDHDKFSFGLKKSLFNYMHGICFDYELQDWFDFKIPRTKITSNYIVSCLEREDVFSIKASSKIIWIGGKPIAEHFIKSKKGNSWEMAKLTFYDKIETVTISLEKDAAEWLIVTLDLISVYNQKNISFSELKSDFESKFDDFELFWYSKSINKLRTIGLLVL